MWFMQTFLIFTCYHYYASVSDMSAKVTNLEVENSRLECELTKVDHRVEVLESQNNVLHLQVKTLKEISLKQETVLKQNNLIFSGIKELGGGAKEDTLKVIYSTIEQKMGVNPNHVRIIKCYRIGAFKAPVTTGPKPSTPRPRPIFVGFNTLGDRQMVWDQRRQLKDKHIYAGEDFPREIERRRSQLYPIMKQAKTLPEYRKGTFLTGDSLMVNKRKYSIDTVNELPPAINPVLHATQHHPDTDVTLFFTRHSVLSNH